MSNLVQSAGWLAPNGDFYPCGHKEHEDLADVLSVRFYPNSLTIHWEQGSRILECHGWIRVVEDGTPMSARLGVLRQATKHQLDTIADLVACNETSVYAENMLRYISLITEEESA